MTVAELFNDQTRRTLIDFHDHTKAVTRKTRLLLDRPRDLEECRVCLLHALVEDKIQKRAVTYARPL